MSNIATAFHDRRMNRQWIAESWNALDPGDRCQLLQLRVPTHVDCRYSLFEELKRLPVHQHLHSERHVVTVTCPITMIDHTLELFRAWNLPFRAIVGCGIDTQSTVETPWVVGPVMLVTCLSASSDIEIAEQKAPLVQDARDGMGDALIQQVVVSFPTLGPRWLCVVPAAYEQNHSMWPLVSIANTTLRLFDRCFPPLKNTDRGQSIDNASSFGNEARGAGASIPNLMLGMSGNARVVRRRTQRCGHCNTCLHPHWKKGCQTKPSLSALSRASSANPVFSACTSGCRDGSIDSRGVDTEECDIESKTSGLSLASDTNAL